jgi:hypothetical protein
MLMISYGIKDLYDFCMQEKIMEASLSCVPFIDPARITYQFLLEDVSLAVQMEASIYHRTTGGYMESY